MNTIDLIFSLLKEVRDLQLKDHEILLRHQQMSESNKKRLDIVEAKAFLINWKQIAMLSGIVSSIAAIVYYISRVI